MGFAHGPLSATSSATATSGVIQFVTPTRIELIGLVQSRDVLFSNLRVRFEPEPGRAVLLSIGMGVLLALARRRLR